VLCDDGQVSDDGQSILGAPPFIIEVLSPSNGLYEMNRKFTAYKDGGVKEYWMVEPQLKEVYLHVLQEGRIFTYKATDTLESKLFAGLALDLSTLF
jgi:Uma2 family endonuclease